MVLLSLDLSARLHHIKGFVFSIHGITASAELYCQGCLSYTDRL
jgi:hypothetical protein